MDTAGRGYTLEHLFTYPPHRATSPDVGPRARALCDQLAEVMVWLDDGLGWRQAALPPELEAACRRIDAACKRLEERRRRPGAEGA